MPYQTKITGELFPIMENDYLGILQELKEVFSGFKWVDEKGGTLKIDSYGKHSEDKLFHIFGKISDIIQSGYALIDRSLEERGEDIEDITVYFFKEGDWLQDVVDVVYPINPYIEKE